MAADRFLPGGHPAAQQQQPQDREQPPLAPHNRKRPRHTDQPLRRPKETPLRTPLASTVTVVVIREFASDARPTVQVGSNVASSSSPPIVRWQTTFMLGNEPLPMTFTIRNWAHGEGGRISRSLGQVL